MSEKLQNTLIAIFALLALCVILCHNAKAAEPFSVEFKPLKWDTLATEVAWQAENIIDLDQTLQIARDPTHYREVGTMSPLTGPHPTVRQVWLYSALFGVAHYAVTQTLTNAGHENLARAWSYGSLSAKTWNMRRNESIGLRP